MDPVPSKVKGGQAVCDSHLVDRDRKTDTQTETERQRQKDRQTETERQTDRDRKTETEKETEDRSSPIKAKGG